MNIYELLNQFWLENEYGPCSATEIALYFFLHTKEKTEIKSDIICIFEAEKYLTVWKSTDILPMRGAMLMG